MVKLPTMPPPGARISTLTVATPTTSLACVETVTVPPSSTGSGASAVLLKDGDGVSRTTTVPGAEAADPAESIAPFPAASEAHTVNAWVPTSAVVYEYAYTSPPDVDIVKFPMTAEAGSRISTEAEATPTLSVIVASIAVAAPRSTGSGDAEGELIDGLAVSRAVASRETNSDALPSAGSGSFPGSTVARPVPRPLTETAGDAVKFVRTYGPGKAN